LIKELTNKTQGINLVIVLASRLTFVPLVLLLRGM
jgi:hypothetical protein